MHENLIIPHYARIQYPPFDVNVFTTKSTNTRQRMITFSSHFSQTEVHKKIAARAAI